MNKRQFAISAAAFIVALAIVSCEPLRGRAIEISVGEQAGIQDYFQTYGENLNAIDISYNTDEDGNSSAHLAVIGIQRAALSDQFAAYDNMNFSAAPTSVSVSGSNTTCGTYLLDGQQRRVTVYPNRPGIYPSGSSYTLATATDYTIYLEFGAIPGTTSEFRWWEGGSMQSDYNGVLTLRATGNFFNPNERTIENFGSSQYYWGIASGITGTIPEFSSTNKPDVTSFVMNFNLDHRYSALGGQGVAVTVPSGENDTAKPWDYYNNVILPYIENNYGDLIDLQDFLVFPDRYEPPAQPSTVPVQYPTIPGFDFALETNGTEPPTDINYNIPDMPGKDIAVPAFDLNQISPREVMAPVAGGLRGIWELIGNVCTEFNLFPYVGIAVFAAIVFTLMRLGK